MAHSVTVICSLYFHLQVWHLMVTIPQQFGIPFSVDPQREPGNSKKESWLRTRSGMRFVRYWIYLSDLYVVICGEFNFPETNVIVNGISNQQISSRGIIVQGRMDDDDNIYFKAPSSTGWWFQPLWKILHFVTLFCGATRQTCDPVTRPFLAVSWSLQLAIRPCPRWNIAGARFGPGWSDLPGLCPPVANAVWSRPAIWLLRWKKVWPSWSGSPIHSVSDSTSTYAKRGSIGCPMTTELGLELLLLLRTSAFCYTKAPNVLCAVEKSKTIGYPICKPTVVILVPSPSHILSTTYVVVACSPHHTVSPTSAEPSSHSE